MEKEVLKYMTLQSRPRTISDICKELGKDSSKIESAIDNLLAEGKLKEKVYNRQKIYCIFEKSVASDLQSQLQKLNQEIANKSNELKEMSKQLQIGVDELKSLQGQLSLQEAKDQQDTLSKEVSNLNDEMNKLKERSTMVTAEEKQKAKTMYEENVKEYRKRKRMCMDIVNTILENYPSTKESLLNDMGVETDEDVNFFLPC